MKIGIITIQKSSASYGANLQAYALWKFLVSQGHEVEIIDLLRPVQSGYIHSVNKVAYHTYSYKKRKEHIASFLTPSFLIRRIKFQKQKVKIRRFYMKVKYSKPFYSIDSLYSDPPKYDAYLSGSDQIWNPDMPFELAPYFLDFVKDGKKISYASSMGKNEIDKNTLKQYEIWLKSYSSIGVREQFSVDLLKSVGINAHLVLDPVFLIDPSCWKKMAKDYKYNGKYLFFFSFTNDEAINKQIGDFANQRGMGVVSNLKMINVSCKSAGSLGIEEWLGCILNSELVITDSFHAVAFSIILQKTFYVFNSKSDLLSKRSERQENLLRIANLSDRFIDLDELSHIDSLAPIDYGEVVSEMNGMLDSSKKYLIDALDKQ